jgi:hypothetical protein
VSEEKKDWLWGKKERERERDGEAGWVGRVEEVLGVLGPGYIDQRVV